MWEGVPTYNGSIIDTQRGVDDTLISTDNTISLSAKQGKVLKDAQDLQQSEINLNNAKVSYPGDQDLSGINTNAIAIALNTAKVGYTESAVSSNTDVAANTSKVGVTPSQQTLLGNTSGTNTGDQDLSGYLLNTTDTFTGDLTIDGKINVNTIEVPNRNSSGVDDDTAWIHLDTSGSNGGNDSGITLGKRASEDDEMGGPTLFEDKVKWCLLLDD